jgi:hypothetical protein
MIFKDYLWVRLFNFPWSANRVDCAKFLQVVGAGLSQDFQPFGSW